MAHLPNNYRFLTDAQRRAALERAGFIKSNGEFDRDRFYAYVNYEPDPAVRDIYFSNYDYDDVSDDYDDINIDPYMPGGVYIKPYMPIMYEPQRNPVREAHRVDRVMTEVTAKHYDKMFRGCDPLNNEETETPKQEKKQDMPKKQNVVKEEPTNTMALKPEKMREMRKNIKEKNTNFLKTIVEGTKKVIKCLFFEEVEGNYQK